MLTGFHENLATVRRTAAVHASALNELERAFTTETAKLAAGHEALEVERCAMLKRADKANARERAAVAREREAVDRGRADLEAEVARMAAVHPSSEDHFKLNVGGVRYETSRATLTSVPSSMLATMFGARLDMLRRHPEDGSVFIDRNGERFGLVLDFLRDGGAESQIVARTIRELPGPQQEAMLRELSFFGLADASVFPRSWIDDAEFKALGGGKLNSGRCGCAAVLHERSVVVFGGCDEDEAFNTTEVLDLDAGTTIGAFTAGPTMATARMGCAAVRLDARRVLVVGGRDEPESFSPSLDTTDILDFETMCFSAGPTMLSRRGDCAAVVLDARRILVAGGGDEDTCHRTTEILDVATMTFAPGPDMLSERNGCSAVALDPRRVLIVGGCTSEDANLSTTEVLDLDTMKFSRGPTMRTGRYGCAAVPLGGDSRHCLVIGGLDDDGTELFTTEVLELETMEFTDGPAILAKREGFAAVADAERVFVLGGWARYLDGSLSVDIKTEVLEATAQTARATRRRRC